MIEFVTVPDQIGFDVLAFNEIDSQLWDIPDFFRKHLRDLLLGQAINELNPKLVLLRFP